MPHLPNFADDAEVILDGHPLKVKGEVDWNMLNISGRKVAQGDPGPDDHPVNSTFTQRTWQGGGQIHRNNPATDTDRYWWGKVLSRFRGVLTNPLLSYNLPTPTGLSGTVWVHGDFLDKFYASWGTTLREYNVAGNHFNGGGATLSNVPVGRGVVFVPGTGALKGAAQLYIPLGAAGLDRWSGSGAVVNTATETALWFEIWDHKLFVLRTDGEVKYTVDGTTWASIGVDGVRLQDGSTPRRLVSYQSNQADPRLYLTTNQGLWLVDYDVQTLHKTDLQFPRHPHQGRAAAVWRGDLHVSVGVGTHRTNGTLITAMGLDRDDGLPSEFADGGLIVDYAPEYNGLYSLSQGAETSVGGAETAEVLTGPSQNNYVGSATIAPWLLTIWDGVGHSYVCAGTGTPPTSVVVSVAGGKYRVWWAAGGKVWYQNLPIGFFNPKQVGIPEFEETGEFESSWINWGWLGMPKILKLIEVYTSGCSATEYVEVYYKLDLETNPWILAGTITTNGEHAYRIGLDTDGNLIGAPHEQVKLRLRWQRGSDPRKHANVEWYSLSCRKFLRPIQTWRFTVDCFETNKGLTKRKIQDILRELATRKTSVPFIHRGELEMVDVVAVSGRDRPGKEDRSVRNVSLIAGQEVV